MSGVQLRLLQKGCQRYSSCCKLDTKGWCGRHNPHVLSYLALRKTTDIAKKEIKSGSSSRYCKAQSTATLEDTRTGSADPSSTSTSSASPVRPGQPFRTRLRCIVRHDALRSCKSVRGKANACLDAAARPPRPHRTRPSSGHKPCTPLH